jgi:hypothetical protein
VRPSPLVEAWDAEKPPLLFLHRNAKLVVRQPLASKDLNTVGEEIMSLKVITRQLVRHSRLRRLSGCCSEM